MALFGKGEQANGTWRLYDNNNAPIGRIWLGAHTDRILRDADLAEAVAAALSLSGAARRQAVRTAFQAWQAAGGRSVDFSNLTVSPNNDAGEEDGNLHFYIAGNEFGYLHGADTPRAQRIARIVALAEEVFTGEQAGSNAARNAALDAAVNRFRDNGGI